MIFVGAIAAVLWGIGAGMGAPHKARWTMIAILLAAVIGVQLGLPDGHPLRTATGGDVRLWLLILAFAGIGLGYRAALRRLRRVADSGTASPPSPQTGTFSATELNRYSRHVMLREIGGPGQRRLRDARVLVVGAGGLGAPVLQYLAAAGVGTIGVIDDDTIDGSNLQRQVIYRDGWIGSPKVHMAEMAMRELNPFVTVRPYLRRLTPDIAADLIAEYDLVLDGTDNFDTRYLVNQTCTQAGVPLISGAITQWEGQISLYDPARGGPCFQCVFPQAPAAGLAPSCAQAGVAGPLPGVIGSMMALEAVKYICDAGAGLMGRLVIHDALYADTRVVTVKPRPDCPVCAGIVRAKPVPI